MTVPRDYGFTEDQQLLKTSVQRFVRDREPLAALRPTFAGTEDPHVGSTRFGFYDTAAWQEMTSLGWQSLAVPAARGGADMGLVSAVAMVEEIGAGAVPSPLNVTIETSFLLREMDSNEAGEVLVRIAGGEAVTWGYLNSTGDPDVDASAVTEKDGTLNGSVHFVQDLQKCRAVVLAARRAGQTAWFVVDVDAAGVTTKHDRIVDLTRDQGTLVLDSAPAAQLTPYRDDDPVFARARPALLTLTAADIAGAAEWMLQTTAEYAKTRVQFDRPIGFFQAVKHPLVDVMVCVDETRSLVYAAAAVFDHDRANAVPAALLAKASASDTAEFAANRGTQLHGGIGFTWESDVQMYHKRLIHGQHLLGDGMACRAELGEWL